MYHHIRRQEGPRVSQSLPELHRHRGVGHPSPPQPTTLHPVLGLVQEVDKADARAILAEYVGYLDPVPGRASPRGAGGHVVLGDDCAAVSRQQPDVQLIHTCVQSAVLEPVHDCDTWLLIIQ